jgi:pyruvate,water dikinase
MASLLLQADHSIVTRSIRWFSEISLADLTVVGGKNASLGELFRNAKSLGIRVPDGFATTAGAFREFMTTNGLSEEVKRLNSELRPDDIAQLQDPRGAVQRRLRTADTSRILGARRPVR